MPAKIAAVLTIRFAEKSEVITASNFSFFKNLKSRSHSIKSNKERKFSLFQRLLSKLTCPEKLSFCSENKVNKYGLNLFLSIADN